MIVLENEKRKLLKSSRIGLGSYHNRGQRLCENFN